MDEIIRVCEKHGELKRKDCYRDNSRKMLRCRACAKDYRERTKVPLGDYSRNKDKEIDDNSWKQINDVFKNVNPKIGITNDK